MSMERGWRNALPHIGQHVFVLHYRRVMWSTMTELFREQAVPNDGLFVGTFTKLYEDGQAMAVRRQARPGNRGSLARVLGNMARHPGALTRAALLEAYPMSDLDPYDRDKVHEWWAAISIPNGRHLDPDEPRARLEQLTTAAESAASYADKAVAHPEAHRAPDTTYDELDAAIDSIGEQFRWLATTLSDVGWAGPSPHLPRSWVDPFRYPLVPPSFQLPEPEWSEPWSIAARIRA